MIKRKKSKKRKIIFVCSFILALFLLAYLYVQSARFNENLKSVIRKKLSSYFASEVEIDRISTDMFNRFILSGVRIGDKEDEEEFISVDRIKISYSLVKIFKNIREPEKLISSITFYNPDIFIDASKERISIPALKNYRSSGSGSGSVPSWTLKVIGGESRILLSGDRSYFLKDFNTVVSLSGYPEIHASSDFKVEELQGKVNLEGSVHAIAGEYSGDVSVSDLNINGLKFLFPKDFFDDFPAGTLDAGLRFSGNINELKKGIDSVNYTGNAMVHDMTWREFKSPSAKLNISPRRILIEKGRIEWKKNSLSVEGIIANYIQKPVANLQVEGDINAEQALKPHGINNVMGAANINAKLAGSIDDYEVSGKLAMSEGSIGSKSFSDLQTLFKYDDNDMEIYSGNMQLAGGKIVWEGKLAYLKDIDISAKAEGLKIDDIFEYDGFDGVLDGDLKVEGTWSNPELNADFTFRELEALHRDFGELSLSAELSDNRVNIKGFTADGNYSLDANSFYNKEKRTFSSVNATVLGLKEEELGITGEIGIRPLSGSLNFTGENIFFHNLNYINDVYGDSSGVFNINGMTEFRPGRFLTSAEVDTDNFRVNNSSFLCSGSFYILGRDNGQTLYKAQIYNLNDYFSMNAEIEKKDEKYSVVKATAEFNGADLAELGYLFHAEKILTGGELKGKAEYTENKRGGKLEFENPSVYGNAFDSAVARISFAGNSFNLVSMTVESGEGYGEITGELYPQQNINMFFNRFKFKDNFLSFNGKYSASSEDEYEFNFNASDITVNGGDFKDILISGFADEEGASVNLESGEHIEASLKAGAGPEGKLDGKVKVYEYGILAFAEAADIDYSVSGFLNAGFEISGTKTSPALSYDCNIRDGLFEEISADLDFSGEYSKEILKLKSLKGKVEKEGTIQAAGTLEKDELDFFFKLDNFLLSSLHENFYSGKIDIEGNITGSVKDFHIDYEKNAKDVEYKNFVFQNISSKGSYKEGIVSFSEGNIIFDSGSISILSGNLNLNDKEKYAVNLNARFENLRTGPIAFLGKAKVKGEIYSSGDLYAELVPDTLLLNRYRLINSVDILLKDSELNVQSEDG
ncbi:MAG: hypothetical protein ACQESB_02785, partial [Elusimicrobiota bacterium]